MRRSAQRALEAGERPHKVSARRSSATIEVLQREGQAAASTTALARHDRAAAGVASSLKWRLIAPLSQRSAKSRGRVIAMPWREGATPQCASRASKQPTFEA